MPVAPTYTRLANDSLPGSDPADLKQSKKAQQTCSAASKMQPILEIIRQLEKGALSHRPGPRGKDRH